jgi:hypothetical protein
MKKAAKTGTYTPLPFRIPPPPPHRKKTEFTITDEDELREARQAVIKLQQRVRELEKEKLQQRISPPQKRISPPQKRQSPSSLPTQIQRVREQNKQEMADLGEFYSKLFARVEEFGIKKKSS